MPHTPHISDDVLAEARAMFDSERRDMLEHASAELPEHIIQILPHAQAVAEGKLDELRARLSPLKAECERVLEEVLRPTLSRKGRMTKLRDLATKFGKAVVPVTACAAGTCAHCCHIPVSVSETEASMIGEAIGRKPKRVSDDKEMSTEFGYHRPCTFLKNNRCSIYAHRPFACRMHFSMDESDRLCALIPGVSVPVPLVDTREFQLVYVRAAAGETVADLRDFFPPR
jgi:Fe-S-cluster containining protein